MCGITGMPAKRASQFAKQVYNIDLFCRRLAATYDEEIDYRSGARRREA